MKVLTMCEGGNSRSVGLKHILQARYGLDAMACSWRYNTPETLEMLFEWADYIVVMQEKFQEKVPEKWNEKLRVVDVGEDKWYNGLHPDLLATIDPLLTDLDIFKK